MSQRLTGGWENSPLFEIIQPVACVEQSVYFGNSDWAADRYPEVIPQSQSGKLAVVGGGSSVANHLDLLRAWDGDIWAVKASAKWLRERGIPSTMISCHPTYDGGDWPKYANRALVSSACPKELFEALSCPVEIFHCDSNRPNLIRGGCTTVTKIPHLAVHVGYREIHFFGCESSMEAQSHVWGEKKTGRRLKIKCDGKEFLAQSDWIWQAEYMCDVFAMAPHVFVNRSPGLMAAMMASRQYEIIV